MEIWVEVKIKLAEGEETRGRIHIARRRRGPTSVRIRRAHRPFYKNPSLPPFPILLLLLPPPERPPFRAASPILFANAAADILFLLPFFVPRLEAMVKSGTSSKTSNSLAFQIVVPPPVRMHRVSQYAESIFLRPLPPHPATAAAAARQHHGTRTIAEEDARIPIVPIDPSS